MRRKALSAPADSARLWMLEYCLSVHQVRFVACLDALKSTQAWPSRFAFDFSLRDSFRQNLTRKQIHGSGPVARRHPGCRACARCE